MSAQNCGLHVVSDFEPSGDQPHAIDKLSKGVESGLRYQTLLGVTGSGKTFTMAKIIERIQKPTLVLAPNKTLAAQLASELQTFFPDNAVVYFVSYYDYYQPEAYVPTTDTFIEKDASINDEVEKLRHAATSSLLSRRDCIVVASVSCIYGIGSPESYAGLSVILDVGAEIERDELIRKLVEMQYDRNDYELERGHFRVRGDNVEIFTPYDDNPIRVTFWGDEIEEICSVDFVTGEILRSFETYYIWPASHYATSNPQLKGAIKSIREELRERLQDLKKNNKLLEAERLEMRTTYDIEMMEQLGFCSGIENYSRHIDGRKPGEPPYTLLDYFGDDYLCIVDESHVTIPQVRGMYEGDRSRKVTLIEHGFRLPSALDNRPLRFDEFENKVPQLIFVSATPGDFEERVSEQTVEQIIRPTGLLDPHIDIRPTISQVDDVIEEVKKRVEKGERTLITTLTKKMAEALSEYLQEQDIRAEYMHSDIGTLERVQILHDLREGKIECLVGINLLREGLDLPEVSLVAILDADKEGFLRNKRSLIQTIGRAARNASGEVIMYADKMTDSVKAAYDETKRRREIQARYNEDHGIVPQTIKKDINDIMDSVNEISQKKADDVNAELSDFSKEEVQKIISTMEDEMFSASVACDFERAATLRDELVKLKSKVSGEDEESVLKNLKKSARRAPKRHKR